ncbi:hypothetical protein BJ166DRAFT_596107 [Pestalotiopsis sp. NC0098]|nr:hypothetical protein BJ166DRAFT_596107 [Pestalotiopsis sp. NC0098]
MARLPPLLTSPRRGAGADHTRLRDQCADRGWLNEYYANEEREAAAAAEQQQQQQQQQPQQLQQPIPAPPPPQQQQQQQEEGEADEDYEEGGSEGEPQHGQEQAHEQELPRAPAPKPTRQQPSPDFPTRSLRTSLFIPHDMVPDDLAGLYQQYNLDTDSVAQWLASTALENGYPQARLPPPMSKANNWKRVSKKGSKKTTASKGRISYRITIEDFTTLSEYVASKQIQVPPTFASTLDRLIIARTDFREQLAKRSNGTTNHTSDQNHLFFVTVLGKALAVQQLHPLDKSRLALLHLARKNPPVKVSALPTSRTHNSQSAASKGYEGGTLGGYDLLQRYISNDELYELGNQAFF